MIHVCIRCELKYTSDYPRAGLCPRCWAEENQINLGKLARGLIDMVEMLEADLVECQRAAARAGLSPDLKKRLLMLAHPDKHGGSPLATRVFQELRDAMTAPAIPKSARGHGQALAVDVQLRGSHALRRELMDTVARAFRDHPHALHPVITWRGHRVRGRATTFRLLAEVQDGGRWVPICERWHD